jgi:hypothetical protein
MPEAEKMSKVSFQKICKIADDTPTRNDATGREG